MAKRSRRTTATRGSVNNIILESLYSGSKYGYEIIKEIEERTNGEIVLKQPSLYSSLSRFESKGFVSSSWADSELGGRRHYYELTDKGKSYYENNVLNKKAMYEFLNDDYDFSMHKLSNQDFADDEESIDDDTSSEENYDYDVSNQDEENYNSYNKYSFSVEDRINSLLNDEEIHDTYIERDQNIEDDTFDSYKEEMEEDNSYSPVDEELDNPGFDKEIAEESDTAYIDKSSSFEDNIRYTHNLSKEMANVYDSLKNKPQQEENNNQYYTDNQKKIESMNILYGNSPQVEEQVHQYVFTESSPKYYIDENGITKKYVQKPEPDQTHTLISNNYRQYGNTSSQTNMFNSSDFEEIMSKSTKTKKTNNVYIEEIELSDEEISRKNQLFKEKFDSIVDSKYGKISNEAEEYEDNFEEDTNFIVKDEEEFVDIDNNDDESYYFAYNKEEPEETEYKIKEDLKISEYNNENTEFSHQLDSNSKYIKINKANFLFGFIMLLVMVVEMTTLLFILKSKVDLISIDYTLFILSFVIIFIVCAIFIIPFFFNPNKRKLNTFKLSYSLILGVLSFLVLSTLTYAVNSFIGFDINNIQYFYAKLLVPIILSANFIIGPIIYKLININQKLY